MDREVVNSDERAPTSEVEGANEVASIPHGNTISSSFEVSSSGSMTTFIVFPRGLPEATPEAPPDEPVDPPPLLEPLDCISNASHTIFFFFFFFFFFLYVKIIFGYYLFIFFRSFQNRS